MRELFRCLARDCSYRDEKLGERFVFHATKNCFQSSWRFLKFSGMYIQIETFMYTITSHKKNSSTMRWNCMSKALCFLQIMAKNHDCPYFTVFLTIKPSSQNILIMLLHITLKLHEHRGSYWRKKLPKTILEEQFPVPRNTAASNIGNGVISLLWQLWCHCNPDQNQFGRRGVGYWVKFPPCKIGSMDIISKTNEWKTGPPK